jgi:hypothetical protein
MSGEPIRLLDDSSIRDELRERLSREATVKPQYDFDRGLARLRAAIANGSADGGEGHSIEPPASRLSVTNYAVKGSVWKLASVVGLAAIALWVGLRAWAPANNVGKLDVVSVAPAANLPAGVTGEEADNLAEMKAALDNSPRTALVLAEAGNARFGQSALVEEREAGAIAALAALGRGAEARARARLFLENHPKSSLSERVRKSAKL